ncbi:MAG: hypothetical protein WC604_00180 [Candidatus Gracilibacteria bacterium]
MPDRRQNEQPATPKEIAEVKLGEIPFRAEDGEDARRETLLAMAGLINEKYGKALGPATGQEPGNSAIATEPAAESQEASENPEAALARYEGQYDQLPGEIRSRCTWEELSSRLAAKESHYLTLATAMQDKGELVYVDEDGNPVFRDGGVEPVMKGMNYNKTREILYGKDYKEGTVHHGYEMPDSVEELRKIEELTGKPFVASDNRKEWRSSWMESKKNASFARYAYFLPYDGSVDLYVVNVPSDEAPRRGVVRLLRVKKMA